MNTDKSLILTIIFCAILYIFGAIVISLYDFDTQKDCRVSLVKTTKLPTSEILQICKGK